MLGSINSIKSVSCFIKNEEIVILWLKILDFSYFFSNFAEIFDALCLKYIEWAYFYDIYIFYGRQIV